MGVCQWFHFGDVEGVERAVSHMRRLGVKRLRTGISWADYHRPGGAAWYEWQTRRLAEFQPLVSIWHTPPSIAEGGLCGGPPTRLRDYADFVWGVIDRWGDRFAELELWNEPNNRLKWAFDRFDPNWRKFADMVGMAARTAHMMGKTTVLGGMTPIDPHWLRLIRDAGALEDVDVIAVHGFPGMWGHGDICWEWRRDWHGWRSKADLIRPLAEGRPIWLTETGSATWDLCPGRPTDGSEQATRLLQAARAPFNRVYWYSIIDLDPARDAIEGFHTDEYEYHLGLVTHGGRAKPAYDTMRRLLNAEATKGRVEEPAGQYKAGPSWPASSPTKQNAGRAKQVSHRSPTYTASSAHDAFDGSNTFPAARPQTDPTPLAATTA